MIGWVIGGRQGRSAGVLDRDHRGLYDHGVVARITDHGLEDVQLVPTVRCFKGISPDGRWLCSEGAVLSFDPHQGRLGPPRPLAGGDALDLHHLLGENVLAVTARDEVWVDGRIHAVSAGRRAHPNHLFAVEDQVWVTRGAAGDVLALDSERCWSIADVVVHDGVVTDDGIWFTTVDGRLVRLDPERGVTRTVDLVEMDDRPPPLGWCRGLAFSRELAWVGFTRLRATATRSRLAWVRGALRGRTVATTHPTRLVAYDLAAGRKVRELDVEPCGFGAIFGLHVSLA